MDYERLGVFYLGRLRTPSGEPGEPLLYASKGLTTHAVILGMTGSGKTGLGIGLLEEAALDGIPALVVDPKGDLGNLLLNFPELRPSDFEPWTDGTASADELAHRWEEGLASWGQGKDRIRKLRDAADVAIYTPGSSAGIPLSILRSLSAPPRALLDDADALRERIGGTVSGLLSLLGVEADTPTSREHVLLATLCETAWSAGRDLEIAALVREIQKPPFERVGVVDLDSFYPAKDRRELAMALNGLLASPGFSSWLSGEPLDVGKLLFTPEGKPRIAVISIAHLPDAQRMFFVTVLLHEILAWTRGLSGTSSLRALFYMDEVAGYFPPVANPPAKAPMITLLKQSRAFGLGCVLATQNPVDLDYKGLSNTGTWFIGRLQTERDKARVLEGLEGASTASGATFDRARMEATIAGLGKRVFLMNDVREDAPALFETRWTLSYLFGPLTKAQIQKLMAGRGKTAEPDRPGAAADALASGRPAVPAEVREVFFRPRAVPPAEGIVYRPALLGRAKLHFVGAKEGVDLWQERSLLAVLDAQGVAWERAEVLEGGLVLDPAPAEGSRFEPLPAPGFQEKSYVEWGRSLADTLYQSATLDLLSAPIVKLVARPGETEGEFAVRLRETLRERRDAAIDALRGKYLAKVEGAVAGERRAQERIDREQSQASQQAMQTAISVGATVLGALFGRKAVSTSTLGRATTAARGVGRTMRERGDVGAAQAQLEAARTKRTALEADLEREVEALTQAHAPERIEVARVSLRPRKSDVEVVEVMLCWVPR